VTGRRGVQRRAHGTVAGASRNRGVQCGAFVGLLEAKTSISISRRCVLVALDHAVARAEAVRHAFLRDRRAADQAAARTAANSPSTLVRPARVHEAIERREIRRAAHAAHAQDLAEAMRSTVRSRRCSMPSAAATPPVMPRIEVVPTSSGGDAVDAGYAGVERWCAPEGGFPRTSRVALVHLRAPTARSAEKTQARARTAGA